jgi:putative transposase
MRRSRFTETQSVAILKEAETGKKTREICRQHGISEATYDHWKAQYGGMSAADLTRLKEIEGEVTQDKRMDAELARENDALKAVLAKKL